MKNLETNTNPNEYEIQVLITIMSERHKSGVTWSSIERDMSKANFTPLATSIAITGLLEKQMIDSSTYTEHYNGEYEGFDLTAKGLTWIMTNQNTLPLKFKNEQNNNYPF